MKLDEQAIRETQVAWFEATGNGDFELLLIIDGQGRRVFDIRPSALWS